MAIKIMKTICYELDPDGNIIREITEKEVRRRRGIGCRIVANCVITPWEDRSAG